MSNLCIEYCIKGICRDAIASKKSKVIIFNGRGLKLDSVPEHQFYIGADHIEVVDSYQYLGISLKPSGSMQYAISELYDKASRAWFAISNVLYKYKRLPVDRAFQLFDSLIRPIALFSCEFWLPNILSKKNFLSKEALLKAWENLNFEVLNQKLCRLLLSVHKKCSRLAALGELGRYPAMIPALKHCLKYEWVLRNGDKNSLITKTIEEMANKPYLDTWYSRIQNIRTVLGIPRLYGCSDSVCLQLNRKLNSSFDRFWIDQVVAVKTGSDGLDHNKLRFYKTLKSSFTQEPYISNILNKSQRAWLTRYRVSAVPTLGIESGRYTRPVTPVTSRICKYCSSNKIDDEKHAILECSTFSIKRNCFIGKFTSLMPNFGQMSPEHQLLTILCPVNAEMAVCVSKYLKIITETRMKLDQGLSNYCEI